MERVHPSKEEMFRKFNALDVINMDTMLSNTLTGQRNKHPMLKLENQIRKMILRSSYSIQQYQIMYQTNSTLR